MDGLDMRSLLRDLTFLQSEGLKQRDCGPNSAYESISASQLGMHQRVFRQLMDKCGVVVQQLGDLAASSHKDTGEALAGSDTLQTELLLVPLLLCHLLPLAAPAHMQAARCAAAHAAARAAMPSLPPATCSPTPCLCPCLLQTRATSQAPHQWRAPRQSSW